MEVGFKTDKGILRKKNEDLLNIPEVYDFLMTEWTFFHMMQSMFDRLMNEIDF